jgi:hypothetical protein
MIGKNLQKSFSPALHPYKVATPLREAEAAVAGGGRGWVVYNAPVRGGSFSPPAKDDLWL